MSSVAKMSNLSVNKKSGNESKGSFKVGAAGGGRRRIVKLRLVSF